MAATRWGGQRKGVYRSNPDQSFISGHVMVMFVTVKHGAGVHGEEGGGVGE